MTEPDRVPTNRPFPHCRSRTCHGGALATPIAVERHYLPELDAMVAALRVALGWASHEWTETGR